MLIRQRAAAAALSRAFGDAPITCARLCICGMEKAGKTTLVHTLKQIARGFFGRLFASSKADARTKGIEIAAVSVRGLAFSVWDYAEFYATHELFLGGRAVYLVLARLESDSPDAKVAALKAVDYWLRFLASRVGGVQPPIVVLAVNVGPECSQDKAARWIADVHAEKLAQFKGVLQLLIDDAKSSTRMKKAARNIHALDCRDHSARSTQDLVDNLAISFVPDLFLPCGCEVNRGRNSMVKQSRLPRYLAGIGEVLHFDGLDAVVLDPLWLTVDVLGSLLSPDVENLQSVRKLYGIGDDGMLDQKTLTKIIRDAPDRGPALNDTQAAMVIDFLCKLEICVARPDDQFLMPTILQCRRPAKVWVASSDHHVFMGRRLRLNSICYILPKGFFKRVQIKLGQALSKEILPTVWKDGIFVCISGAQLIEAMVLLTDSEQSVDIWARCRAGSGDASRQLRVVLDRIVDVVKAARLDSCPGVELIELGLSPKMLAATPGHPDAPLPHGYLMEKLIKSEIPVCIPDHLPSDAEVVEDLVIDVLGPNPQEDKSQSALSTFKYHVFLSHNWGPDAQDRDNHATARRIKEGLEKQYGLRVWFDEQVPDMQRNDIVAAMARGIETSAVFVCLVTRKYLAKVGSVDERDNCDREFRHGTNHRGPAFMIAVPVDAECADPKTKPWTGPVGVALGSHIYPARFDVEAQFEDNIAKLAARVVDICKGLDVAP